MQMIQVELTSQLEYGLPDTVDWGRKWLVYFSAGKSQLVLFDWSINSSAIFLKMDGSVLEEKLSSKILEQSLYFKLDWGSYIVCIARSASKKIGALSP